MTDDGIRIGYSWATAEYFQTEEDVEAPQASNKVGNGEVM